MDEPIIILAYQKAMSTSIDISGAQAKPTYELATPGEDRKSVVGNYGSGYVPLGELIAIHNERVPVGQ